MHDQRRPLPLLAALALSAALSACSSSSSPTAPSASPSPAATPAPGSLVTAVPRDGTTEQPVGAQVTPSAPRIGDRISVSAPGFLTREQVFEAPDVFLWPGDTSYVHEIGYWEFDDGTFRTIRWTAPFTITLDADIAGDAAILAKTREVAAEASRHIGFPIAIGAGGSVTIGVDPSIEADEEAVGQTTVNFRGASLSSARIVFWRRAEITGGPQAAYSNTFLHELGHAIGLGHSILVTDVMTPAEGPGTEQSVYQPGEVQTLHMLYMHRRPGNFFPDRDPALGATAAPSGTFVIRDGRGFRFRR